VGCRLIWFSAWSKRRRGSAPKRHVGYARRSRRSVPTGPPQGALPPARWRARADRPGARSAGFSRSRCSGDRAGPPWPGRSGRGSRWGLASVPFFAFSSSQSRICKVAVRAPARRFRHAVCFTACLNALSLTPFTPLARARARAKSERRAAVFLTLFLDAVLSAWRCRAFAARPGRVVNCRWRRYRAARRQVPLPLLPAGGVPAGARPARSAGLRGTRRELRRWADLPTRSCGWGGFRTGDDSAGESAIGPFLGPGADRVG